jgi:hypothetical protein
MSSPLAQPARRKFQLDGMLAAITTLLTCLGFVLLIGGITAPTLVPASSLAEAVHRVGWFSLELIVLGTSIIFGARLARHGRRAGVVLLLGALALLAISTFAFGGLRGILPAIIFMLAAGPIFRRWGAFN